jgi:hypothetical protein
MTKVLVALAIVGSLAACDGGPTCPDIKPRPAALLCNAGSLAATSHSITWKVGWDAVSREDGSPVTMKVVSQITLEPSGQIATDRSHSSHYESAVTMDGLQPMTQYAAAYTVSQMGGEGVSMICHASARTN